MKNQYKILSLFCALLFLVATASTAWAGNQKGETQNACLTSTVSEAITGKANESQSVKSTSFSLPETERQFIPNSNGCGKPPEPTIVTTTQKSICIQGFCLTFGL